MPKFAVYYATECEWMVQVEADDEYHAREVWWNDAHWLTEPECVSEDMVDTSVNVEEM